MHASIALGSSLIRHDPDDFCDRWNVRKCFLSLRSSPDFRGHSGSNCVNVWIRQARAATTGGCWRRDCRWTGELEIPEMGFKIPCVLFFLFSFFFCATAQIDKISASKPPRSGINALSTQIRRLLRDEGQPDGAHFGPVGSQASRGHRAG